jgi:hypothetical protein
MVMTHDPRIPRSNPSISRPPHPFPATSHPPNNSWWFHRVFDPKEVFEYEDLWNKIVINVRQAPRCFPPSFRLIRSSYCITFQGLFPSLNFPQRGKPLKENTTKTIELETVWVYFWINRTTSVGIRVILISKLGDIFHFVPLHETGESNEPLINRFQLSWAWNTSGRVYSRELAVDKESRIETGREKNFSPILGFLNVHWAVPSNFPHGK